MAVRALQLAVSLLVGGVHAQNCGGFTCGTAGYTLVGNSASLLCSAGPSNACSENYCCAMTCASYPCPLSYTNLGSGLQCPTDVNGGCTQNTCCSTDSGTTGGTTTTVGTTGGTTGETNGATTGGTTGGTTGSNAQQINVEVVVVTYAETAAATTAATSAATSAATTAATTAVTTAAPTAAATTSGGSGNGILGQGGSTTGGIAPLPNLGGNSMPASIPQALQYGSIESALSGLWGRSPSLKESLRGTARLPAAGMAVGLSALATAVMLGLRTVSHGRMRGVTAADFQALEAGNPTLGGQ